MRCNVCGGTRFEDRNVRQLFELGQKPVLVENIPARVCEQCGGATFSGETVELVPPTRPHGHPPDRRATVDIFDLNSVRHCNE